jgi:hypothetical protein
MVNQADSLNVKKRDNSQLVLWGITDAGQLISAIFSITFTKWFYEKQ